MRPERRPACLCPAKSQSAMCRRRHGRILNSAKDSSPGTEHLNLRANICLSAERISANTVLISNHQPSSQRLSSSPWICRDRTMKRSRRWLTERVFRFHVLPPLRILNPWTIGSSRAGSESWASATSPSRISLPYNAPIMQISSNRIIFIDSEEGPVPYSIGTTKQVCSACLEFFNIIGANFRKKLVVPCPGAVLYAGMSVNTYYEVKTISSDPIFIDLSWISSISPEC